MNIPSLKIHSLPCNYCRAGLFVSVNINSSADKAELRLGCLLFNYNIFLPVFQAVEPLFYLIFVDFSFKALYNITGDFA
jgi:hypothetical protein